MGNRFTVRNDSCTNVTCYVFPVGLKCLKQEKVIQANSTEIFKFRRSSKSFIIYIENKASRAMFKSKIACLKQITNGEFIIVAEDLGSNIIANSRDVLESYEMDANWNLVRDENVKDKLKKSFTENLGLMMALNKHVSAVLGMLCEIGVAKVSGSKDAAKLASKLSTDFFTYYLKISLPQLELKEDPLILLNINVIYQTLIAISREASSGYPLLSQSIKSDNNILILYLHGLLSKITTGLPFLEQCGLEEAVPIYIFAMTVILDIISKIKELSTNEITEVEETYAKVFINNLKEMWNVVIDNIESNTKMKTKGFFVKKVTLFYKGYLIYNIKSVWKRRAIERIEEIKKEFIKNRKYQLELIYDHPSDFVRRFSES